MTVGEWLNHVIFHAGDPEISAPDELEGLRAKDLIEAIEHLNRRVGAADSKSVEAINNFSRNLGGVVERLQRLERDKPGDPVALAALEARLSKVETSRKDRERLEALKALEKAVSQVALQYNTAQTSSIARIEASERQLQEFASRFDTADNDGGSERPGIGLQKEMLDDLLTRLNRVEQIAEEATQLREQATRTADAKFVERTGKRLRVLGDEIKRGGNQIRTLEQSIRKLSEQIDGAERRSSEGVQKVAETITELRQQFSQVDAQDAKQARNEIESAVSAATEHAEKRITELQTSFEKMIARLEGRDLPLDAVAEKNTLLPTANEGDADPVDAGSTEDADEAFSAQEAEAELPITIAPEPRSGAPEENDVEATEIKDDDIPEDAFDMAFDSFDLDNGSELTTGRGDESSELHVSGQQDSDADDFNFDLDDNDFDDTLVTENKTAAQKLLEEMKDVFSVRAGQSRKEESVDSDKGDGTEEQLSNDDQASIQQSSDTQSIETQNIAEDREANRATAKAMLLGQPDQEFETPSVDQDVHEQPSRDYLKEARRTAREAATQKKSKTLSARERIAAKQKALFSSRPNNKRLVGEKIVDEKPLATAQRMPGEPTKKEDKEKESTGISGALDAIRARIPFLKTPDRLAEGPDDKFLNNPQVSSGNLQLASSKPMTIALIVAIVLSAAALLFVLKDIVFGPPAPPDGDQAATAIETQNNLAETPSTENSPPPVGDVINPRDLYTESILAFQSAVGETELADAIKGLEQAAALGHPPAQLQLGEFYKTGQGVGQDLSQARLWYQRAANGGNILAMHRLGVMTARAEGGPADAATAIRWFEQASNHGLLDSQFNLGTLYDPSNDGFTSSIQDAGKAYYWYSIASLNGDQQAGPLASGLASTLTPEKKQEIDAEVASWQKLPTDAQANEIASAS